MRVAVVGGGVAGALLALRLRREERADVEVFAGAPSTSDASAASGGLVRGFDLEPDAARAASESLAELRADDELRTWAGYREIGSLYVLPEGADPDASVAVVDGLLPGSAAVVGAAELSARFGFRGLPGDAAGVVERLAGFLSPARLREHALKWLADNGVEVRHVRVTEVSPGAAVRLAGGAERLFDAVVVAAGAWTPGLLGTRELRTKQIQYGVYRVSLPGLGVFVDDATGLYGRPHGEGTFLLGLGCDRWDVDPAGVTPDHDLARRVLDRVGERFGAVGEPERVVASFDCYRSPAGLRLESLGDGVFTFTGGSGGAAKTVLAASRAAARELVVR